MVPNTSCFLELVADLRQLDEHDVAELALRVVGDADRTTFVVAGGLHVLVLFGVEKILRDRRHEGLSRSSRDVEEEREV